MENFHLRVMSFLYFRILVPSSDDLKKLMLQHGGMFHHYYTRSKVTHIIASNLPNSKIDKIHDKKIVKPEWITDR